MDLSCDDATASHLKSTSPECHDANYQDIYIKPWVVHTGPHYNAAISGNNTGPSCEREVCGPSSRRFLTSIMSHASEDFRFLR